MYHFGRGKGASHEIPHGCLGKASFEERKSFPPGSWQLGLTNGRLRSTSPFNAFVTRMRYHISKRYLTHACVGYFLRAERKWFLKIDLS